MRNSSIFFCALALVFIVSSCYGGRLISGKRGRFFGLKSRCDIICPVGYVLDISICDCVVRKSFRFRKVFRRPVVFKRRRRFNVKRIVRRPKRVFGFKNYDYDYGH